MAEPKLDAPYIAGKTVMEIASRHGIKTQAGIITAIRNNEGLEIDHQKLSQWISGQASFPNDFAQIFTQALDLGADEQIELALALSYGQRRTRLLRPGGA